MDGGIGYIHLSPTGLYIQPYSTSYLTLMSTSEIGFVEILTASNKARTLHSTENLDKNGQNNHFSVQFCPLFDGFDFHNSFVFKQLQMSSLKSGTFA